MIAQKFRLYKKLRVIRQVKKISKLEMATQRCPLEKKKQLNALPFDSTAYFADIGR